MKMIFVAIIFIVWHSFSIFKIVHLNSNILTYSKQISWINEMLVFFRFNPAMQQSVFDFNCPLKYIRTTKLAKLCTEAHILLFFQRKNKPERKRYCFRCFIRFYLFIERESKTLAIVSTTMLCVYTRSKTLSRLREMSLFICVCSKCSIYR